MGWLRVEQQGQMMQFGAHAANTQYRTSLVGRDSRYSVRILTLPRNYYVGTNTTGSELTFTSQAVDSTDFTVSTDFYNLCFANEVAPDVDFTQANGRHGDWFRT
jgi:hypothetical protein